MSTLWFTSDTHLMHDKLAREIRGFDNIADHDAALVSNFNSKIAPGDTVFCLGDVSLKKPDVFGHLIGQLNGDWHLISGNHDACWPGHRDAYKYNKAYIDIGFKSVQPFARRKLNGINFLMSHFPYAGDHTKDQRYTQYRMRNEGMVLLHGHTHSDQIVSFATRKTGFLRKQKVLQIHVGLDAWNLMPVNVDEVVSIAKDY